MKSNYLSNTVKALYEQMMAVKDANPSELDIEAKRLTNMCEGADKIKGLVSEEIRLIIGAGMIPQDSTVVVGIKEAIEKTTKPNRLLVDEFTRK